MEYINVRKIFTPRPRCLFVRSDYSQLEVRINAHYSQDKALIAALMSGEDLHSYIAKEIFNLPCPVGQVKTLYKKFRSAAKAIVFGLAYGITKYGLALRLGITEDEAQAYIDAFFMKYPGLLASQNFCRDYVIRNKFIPTVMGKKRRFKFVSSKSLRQGMNFPIQSTASEVTKAAMVEVFEQLKQTGLDKVAVMLMQIHDEILLESEIAYVDQVKLLVKNAMELGLSKFGINMCVPLTTDPTVDYAWGFSMKEAKEEEQDFLGLLRAGFDSMDVAQADKACKNYYNVFFREIPRVYRDTADTLPGNKIIRLSNSASIPKYPDNSAFAFREGELEYLVSQFSKDPLYSTYRARFWQ